MHLSEFETQQQSNGPQHQPPSATTQFVQATVFNQLLSNRNAKCLLGDWMTVFFNLFRTEVWDICALSFKDNRFRQSTQEVSQEVLAVPGLLSPQSALHKG